MNLREELLSNYSLTQATKIGAWAVESPNNLKSLMDSFLATEKIIVQRASWAASKAYDLKPQLFDTYIPQLIGCLDEPIHGSVRRNSLRILQSMQIPEKHQGELIDKLFAMLHDPKEECAVKAFAMTAAFNIVQHFPELGNELKIIIEDQLPFATPSFRSRAKRITKKL